MIDPSIKENRLAVNKLGDQSDRQIRIPPLPTPAPQRWPHNYTDIEFTDVAARLNVISFVSGLVDILREGQAGGGL